MENIDEIRVLGFPEAIRKRPGMYLGSVTDATQLLMELIGNAEDEISKHDYCNKTIIDQNWNGWVLCMDNGAGMPLELSKDIPTQSSMEVALTNLHAGSKFESTDKARIGMNGCGLKACVATSESFIMMSKITLDNYNKSIPLVEKTWNRFGPRSKRDLYYVLGYQRGYKVYEKAGKLDEIEGDIFGKGQFEQLPRGFSTIVLLRPDSEIFESIETKLPIKSLQYFLLIQEKINKKKVEIVVNKQLINGTFSPYKYEFLKTIIPANTEKNKFITIYVTFEVDPELGQKQESGAVVGLECEGVHIDYVRSCYEIALKDYFKIKHKYLTNGLRLCVVLIAEDLVFNSQNKERLKSISKVKLADFKEVAKEFQKIFRNDSEYWQEHVARLNYLADSMRSLSSEEKITKMIEESQGNAYYKTKNTIVDGYAAATAGPDDRWNCSLYCVEGLSPFGSLKNARLDIKHQACLALRGKVKGLAKYTDYDKGVESLLENKEYFSIFKLIGLGVGKTSVINGCKTKEEAYEKVRKYAKYGSIIISTDMDEDGLSIMSGLLYTFSRFARFMIEFGMIKIAESPIYIQGNKFFYPSDPLIPGTRFPQGLDLNKDFKHIKGLGGLNREEASLAFFNSSTSKIITVTTEGIDYSMGLVEDINNRRQLLINHNILTNPYNFNDLW